MQFLFVPVSTQNIPISICVVLEAAAGGAMLAVTRTLLLQAAGRLEQRGLLALLPTGLASMRNTWLVTPEQPQPQQCMLQPQLPPWGGLQLRLLSSKARPSRKQTPSAGRHKKQHHLQQQAVVDRVATQQQQQQLLRPATPTQGRRAPSSSGSSRQGSRARSQPTLPSAAANPPAAVTPQLGRVPPSSSAAAAAAAAALRPQHSKQTAAAGAAATPQQQRQQQDTPPGLLRHRPRRSKAAKAAAAAAAAADEAAAEAAAAAALQPFSHLQPNRNILPWELVGSLPRSSPFSLERMASGGVRTYLAYMAAARRGAPSVFDLGACFQDGYSGRRRLLQRQRLLEMLLQQLHTMQQLVQGLGQGQEGAAAPAEPSAAAAAGEWEPTDEQLAELSEQHIQAVVDAARESGGALLAGVGGQDVALCLVDYFVFKRCMEVLLLQRQHREAMQAKHEALMQEYHRQAQQQQQETEQQQGQEQQQQQQQQQPPPLTFLTASELSEVKVWDAFFDVTLPDYIKYLQTASQGHPSVFTASREDVLLDPHPPAQHQHQRNDQQHAQQQQAQVQEEAVLEFQRTCCVLAMTASTLSQLRPVVQQLPRLVPRHELLRVVPQQQGGTGSGGVLTKQDVPLGVYLQEFHEAKRQAFKEALEELVAAAGQEAAGSLDRF